MDVYVQMPAFHEGYAYGDTLEAIAAQDVPDDVSVTREVWVTPGCPDIEMCRTWQTAQAADGWDAYEAPQGYLSTRNKAHSHAVDQGADVIIKCDADAVPAHDKVHASLLRHLSGDVVAVNSNPRPTVRNPFNWPIIGLQRLEDAVRPHINSQTVAITAEGWQQAGPFDTDRDETNVSRVRQEAEFNFYRRLQEVGSVVTADQAVVIEGARRPACLTDRAMSRFGSYPTRQYCDDMGTLTFEPRGRRD